MENELFDIVLSNVYTLRELKHKLRILKSYLESNVFGSKVTDLPADDANWISSLPQDFLQKFTKDNLTKIFTDFENKIKTLSPLIIYTSFEPTAVEIEKIHLWLKQNSTQRLFETKLNPDLIGGAAFVQNGVYKDYSLRQRINEQKDLILTEFKKYVR
jgi:hypothetical protein